MEAIKTENEKELRSYFIKEPDMLHFETPLGSWLHIATRKGKNQIAIMLVDLGIDVNAKMGPAMGTPINVAASEGNEELVRFLLSKHAELDVSEPEKNPLFSAIHNGHKDIVKILLDAGIDSSAAYTGDTMKNMDAIAFAKEWGRIEIVELLENHLKSTSK